VSSRPASAPVRSDDFFDALTRLVTARLHVPIAMISVVTPDEQLMLGATGLPEPWESERTMPLSYSLCKHVVSTQQPLLVDNAHDDGRVAHNPAVLDLGVIAYAGVPVQPQERIVGAVCAIDHRPRQWTDGDVSVLSGVAETASAELGRRSLP
jgi:GAF domain-containing protein